MISYAQNFEDVLLYRCFGKLSDGFYVDIGAYHPVNDSVTKAFYDAGWSGINVEPGPGIEALREQRPRDINLEVAISSGEGEADFWEHSAGLGTSTLLPEVGDMVAGVAGERIHRRVRTISLAQLLARYAEERHIHFLKLDAEGSEDAIIAGGDWKRFRPEVLIIESTEILTNKRIDAHWQALLGGFGYAFAYFDGINDFWVREESAGLLKAFALPVNVLDQFRVYDANAESLWRDLVAAREKAEETQLTLARVQEELQSARQAAADTQVALAEAQAELHRAGKDKAALQVALAEAQAELLRAGEDKAALQTSLAESQRILRSVQAQAETTECDLRKAEQEVQSARLAAADLDQWRRRLFNKLKAEDAPRELRLVLPIAKLAQIFVRKGEQLSAELKQPDAKAGKHPLIYKLGKGLDLARKRAERLAVSGARAALVPMTVQLARRAPKLFKKVRRDVRRKIGDYEAAGYAADKALMSQEVEDAVLTLLLHGNQQFSEHPMTTRIANK
ncbi:MAG: FkbM family methyltransferase [Rhodospirillales bacterium]|nr:FkbM family methyltransferase [Rhodospirillales bacterium]